MKKQISKRREILKPLVPLIAIVLTMSLGCGKKSDPSDPSTAKQGNRTVTSPDAATIRQTTTKQGNTTVPSLDTEAFKKTLERWKPTKIGESHYVCIIVSKRDNTDSERFVFELRNFRVESTRDYLSEADKLNGKQWVGKILLKADAGRMYCPQGRLGDFGVKIPPDTTWTKWESNVLFVEHWDKTNNKWSEAFDEVGGPLVWGYCINQYADQIITFKQVEPSDLPKGD